MARKKVIVFVTRNFFPEANGTRAGKPHYCDKDKSGDDDERWTVTKTDERVVSPDLWGYGGFQRGY
jgi:hypothetical protein